MKEVILYLILLWAPIAFVNAQTNSIKQNIRKCYNDSALPGIRFADNRPPATLNILVEIIRRLEDANPTKNARELSVLILQRWRQDGIRNTGKNVDLRFGLPYMPSRLEAYLSTLILDRFLTNLTSELYPGSLDDADLCTLHYIISSTIDSAVRNDESRTCARSARYTNRIIRAVQMKPTKDIETVVEGIDGFASRTPLGSGAPELSQCPIELGVIYTSSGALKAPLVLAGIAAGLNFERVGTGGNNCNNGYAATLAGELAEVALAQATEKIDIGAAGGWNSTLNPKYYFLQKSQFLQLTDAEIRGAVDGLYMASKMAERKGKFDLKISQILDIYYSPYQKGLFAPDFTSCNRNKLYTSVTSNEVMQKEVLCIMRPLDDVAQFGQTVDEQTYGSLGNAALDSFNNYFPRMVSGDMKCINQNDAIERAAADLLVFIDTTWSYETLKPALSAILDGIDVSRYGSRYTLYLGSDGTNITTTRTDYLLDFHKFYNKTFHDKASKGFDYTKVYQRVEDEVRSKLNNNSYTAGESTIVLLMPKRGPNDDERNFLEQQKQKFKRILPDVSVIVLGTGSSSDYGSVLLNPSKDFVLLTESSSESGLNNLARETVDRVKNIPRAIVNPNCKADFTGSSSSFQMVNYAEVNGVNYYRISPHYFHTGGENRKLKVMENSYGTIEVCLSRDQPKPSNQSSSQCETIRSKDKTFDLSSFCGGSVADCAPVYLSVAGRKSDSYKCRDYFCRYPDNIKYTISMENLGCTSGSLRLLSSYVLVAVLFAILKF